MGQTAVSINTGHHRASVRARRDRLVDENLGLVAGIARQLARKLPPCFDVDDLISAGHTALVEAATRYRPGAHDGAPFSAFARALIRGAMLESVRQIWSDGRNKHAEKPLGEQLAPEHCEIPSIDDRLEAVIDGGRMAARLSEAMSWLTPKQRAVLTEYYGVDEPTLAQAAARLGRSTSSVRQLRAAAIEELRRRFRITGIAA